MCDCVNSWIGVEKSSEKQTNNESPEFVALTNLLLFCLFVFCRSFNIFVLWCHAQVRKLKMFEKYIVRIVTERHDEFDILANLENQGQ